MPMCCRRGWFVDYGKGNPGNGNPGKEPLIAGNVMFKPGKVPPPPKGPNPPPTLPPKGPIPPKLPPKGPIPPKPPPPPKGPSPPRPPPKGKGPNLLPSTVDMRLAMPNIKTTNQDILTKNCVLFAMMKIC